MTHNIANSRFEVNLGNEKAVLIYMIKANLFILLHTEVPPAYEGRGIANKMAHTALNYARRKTYQVRSYCSFTTIYIEKHQEFHDLLG